MAIQKCHECGKDVSTTAKACPNCGASVKKPLLQKNIGCLVVVSLIVLLWIGSKCSVPSFDSYREKAKEGQTTEKAATDYRSCNVPMKDGSYETTRCNDLEELSKDYIFYRKKILQANQEGNTKKVNEYRAKFQQINAWLSRYNDSDVSKTISHFEGR